MKPKVTEKETSTNNQAGVMELGANLEDKLNLKHTNKKMHTGVYRDALTPKSQVQRFKLN